MWQRGRRQRQHRILFFGILGALVFRVIFIALGAVLLQYKAIVIFIGVLLIATDAKILFAPAKPIDPEANLVIRLLRSPAVLLRQCLQHIYTLGGLHRHHDLRYRALRV